MNLNGISTTTKIGAPQLQQLKNANRQFIFRYYSQETTWKDILRRDEAVLISGAGLSIGAVYEYGGGAPRDKQEEQQGITHPEDFDEPIAERDAKTALDQAAAVGQPNGSAIYFAVDWNFNDASTVQLVIAYFQKIADFFRSSNSGNLPYSLGVYGSGYICDQVKGAVADVKYSWLADATGWDGSGSYANWDVKQYIVSVPISQVSNYEDDAAPGDFGGFTCS